MPDRGAQRYEALVRAHAPDLFRFAYRLTGTRAAAEDLLQETFSEAWRCLAQLRKPAAARAWLLQILRHRHAHSQRGAARRPTLGGDIDRLESGEQDGSMRDALQRALDELDDRFKVPFLLVFLEGLTCQETADELGVPLGTVLSRIHRARIALRASLDEPAVPQKVVRLDDVPRAQGRRP
jgi:RNA polymerase sigma-70 factor, ECF subfamily